MSRTMIKEAHRRRIHGAELTIEHLVPDEEWDASTIILFSHEGLGSIAQWKGFPEELCQAMRCRGIVYERHGHGSSQPAVRRRDLLFFKEEAVEIIPDVLPADTIGRLILLGHSDGATISLYHASVYPARVDAVIALAPHVFVEERTLAGVRTAQQRFQTGDMRPKLEKYHKNNTNAMFAAYCALWLNPDDRNWNMYGTLSTIRCPVLVIQGEQDEYGSEEQLKAISTHVPAAVKTVLIENCRHMPHIEARSVVLDECSRFLNSL